MSSFLDACLPNQDALVAVWAALGALVGTAALAAVWKPFSLMSTAGIRWWNSRKVHTVDIFSEQQLDAIKDLVADYYCLIVRFGNDSYLSATASDADRVQGQLQLKIKKMEWSEDKKTGRYLHLRLPVHNRLGTQFKCFIRTKYLKDVHQVIGTLKSTSGIDPESVDQSDSQHKDRIYFLLNCFTTVKTVDGLVNNFIYPE